MSTVSQSQTKAPSLSYNRVLAHQAEVHESVKHHWACAKTKLKAAIRLGGRRLHFGVGHKVFRKSMTGTPSTAGIRKKKRPSLLEKLKLDRETIPCSLVGEVHVKGPRDGPVFLPFCAKPSFLQLVNRHEDLIEQAIRLALTTTDADLIMFIADGDVMAEAMMAISSSATRARRITRLLGAKLREKIDVAVAKVNNPRIKGVVHWKDVAKTSSFNEMMVVLGQIMAYDGDELPSTTSSGDMNVADGTMQIQRQIKTLVKNLFTQRVAKARASGFPVTNPFTGNGLEMLSGRRYRKRYRHLERACLLELAIIMVGLQHDKQTHTEMRYLTSNPQGMTYIAGCLQQMYQTIARLPSCASTKWLKSVATKMPGITFLKVEIKRDYLVPSK